MAVDSLIINKKTVPLGGKLFQACVIDGKHGMDNFNTTDLHRVSQLGQPYVHKKTTIKSHSNE